MCLPLGFLQFTTVISNTLTAGLGIFSLAYGAYKHSTGVTIAIQALNQLNEGLALALIIAGALLIVLGILGMIAAIRKGRQTLIFANIFIILFSLVFFAIGAVAGAVHNGDVGPLGASSQCQNNTALQQYNQDWHTAAAAFCQASCICKITNPSQWPAGELNGLVYNSLIGSTNFQQCYGAVADLAGGNSTIQLLNQLEMTQNCTGVCTGTNQQIFSDINRGPVTNPNGCYTQIRQYVLNLVEDVEIIGFVIGAFLLLTAILGFCLRCHKDRGKKHLGHIPKRAYEVVIAKSPIS